MSRIISRYRRMAAEKGWLRKRLIPILTVCLVAGVTVAIFLNREAIDTLGSYGYLGAFLVSLAANATIVLPIPGIFIIFSLGAVPGLHPVLIGLAGASGGAIGELTGYMLGHSGRTFIENREVYIRAVRWLRRWGSLAIFVFAVNPFLPLDIVGIAAGNLRFPLRKFMAVCWCGKLILYSVAAYAGAWGWEFVFPYSC